MFSMKQVSRKIVEFRKAKNMTQTELADQMNVSFQAVSNWERGNSMPDISKLPQLAELFGCSVDELLDGKSELLNSAIKDDLQEYVENNDISREELEAVVPVLKPDQVEVIADNMLSKNGDNLNIFYPFLDSDALTELAERKNRKGEPINDMLPFLDDEYIGRIALQKYEEGQAINAFYPFLDDEVLRELAKRKVGKGESIKNMMPFLDRDFLKVIAMSRV